MNRILFVSLCLTGVIVFGTRNTEAAKKEPNNTKVVKQNKTKMYYNMKK